MCTRRRCYKQFSLHFRSLFPRRIAVFIRFNIALNKHHETINKIALRIVERSQVFKGQKLSAQFQIIQLERSTTKKFWITSYLACCSVFVRDDFVHHNFTFYFPFQTLVWCLISLLLEAPQGIFRSHRQRRLRCCQVEHFSNYAILMFLHCPFVRCFLKTAEMKTRARTKVSVFRWRHLLLWIIVGRCRFNLSRK